MVGVEQGRGPNGVSLDRGHCGRARHLRQRNGRKQCDDGKDANDFQQGEAGIITSVSAPSS